MQMVQMSACVPVYVYTAGQQVFSQGIAFS